MRRPQKFDALPDLPDAIDPQLRLFLEALRETLNVREGRIGNSNDRHVTIQQLIDAGVVAEGDIP